jgi:hypothetical protein
VQEWWVDLMAGAADRPHPAFGERIRAKLRDGVLRLSGEVASQKDRQAVIQEAAQFVGNGVDDVDARRLRVARRDDKPGLLEQRIIATFGNRKLAEFARAFLSEHGHLEPRAVEIIDPDHPDRARLAGDFEPDVRRALEAGRSVLILRADETEAFELRELLDEETRSLWTVAMPPEPSRKT